MQAKDILVKTPTPVPAVSTAVAPKIPKITTIKAAPKDELVQSKPAKRPVPSPSAKVPGEDVRNGVSIFGQIFGPIVTVQETVSNLKGVSLLARFGDIPVLGKALQVVAPVGQVLARSTVGKLVARHAQGIANLPIFRSPSFQAVWGKVKPFLKGVSVVLTAFDAYAFVRTLFNKDASVARKALTGGRFLANAVALAVMLRLPSAGVALSNIPAFVGNLFEYALMWLNGKEAKEAKAEAKQA